MKSAATGAGNVSADSVRSADPPGDVESAGGVRSAGRVDPPGDAYSVGPDDVRLLLQQTAREIDAGLDRLLAGALDAGRGQSAAGDAGTAAAGDNAAADTAAGNATKLAEAMRYSLLSGGKRLRPTLVLWSCEACGGRREAAMPAALAIECVHAFSLIHDDLPALDNDDLRRGRPTCHRVYGDATAILAGDALLALAFETIAGAVPDAAVAVAQVRELAAAAGLRGMIGGESLDLEGERQPQSEQAAVRIARLKTARLIESACLLGALAAGAGESVRLSVGRYGRSLGLAFQITDDLLDACGHGERLGKRVQKDAGAGKQTLVASVGIAAAQAAARRHADEAAAALAPLGAEGSRLAALAEYVISRDS